MPSRNLVNLLVKQRIEVSNSFNISLDMNEINYYRNQVQISSLTVGN
jgi:hypothetical protein